MLGAIHFVLTFTDEFTEYSRRMLIQS